MPISFAARGPLTLTSPSVFFLVFDPATMGDNLAGIGKWNTPSSIASQLTTELNSLGNNTMSAASATYDNSTNLNIYVDIEVNLASLSPTAGAYVAIYVLCAPDGTN